MLSAVKHLCTAFWILREAQDDFFSDLKIIQKDKVMVTSPKSDYAY
jgi:hypothetical protein